MEFPDLNPRRLGYKSRLYWSGGKEKKRIAVGRGLDLQAVGTAVKTDNSSRAGYICVYNGMKTQRIYEKECTIYREQFKLPAYFLGGTCYMVSPSVTSSERAEDLHSQCKVPYFVMLNVLWEWAFNLFQKNRRARWETIDYWDCSGGWRAFLDPNRGPLELWTGSILGSGPGEAF